MRHLREAVATLAEVGPIRVSPVYETAPVGGPEEQGDYLNLVVELRTDPPAPSCWACATGSRPRPGGCATSAGGPRTLDVDVLWVDGVTVDEPDLVVPHPRLWERRFVVRPCTTSPPTWPTRRRSSGRGHGRTGPAGRADASTSCDGPPGRAGERRRVRIVGPGRAGRACSPALGRAGWDVAPLVGRDGDVAGAADGVDLVVLATPDGAVAAVAAAVGRSPGPSSPTSPAPSASTCSPPTSGGRPSTR